MGLQEGRKGIRPPLWRVFWLVLLLLSVWTFTLHAETQLLRRQALVLRAGMVMEFATHQKKGVKDIYTSRVTIEEIQVDRAGAPQRIKFQWRMFNFQTHRNFDHKGFVTTTGFRRGRSFNAWWTRGRHVVTSDTHLWLSQRACRELENTGQTRYALDKQMRSDELLLLERLRTVRYPIKVDGREVNFRAWELRSELGDRVVLLADCAHPLVLEMDLPGVYEIRIEKISSGG